MSLEQIQATVEKLGTAWEQFKSENDTRLKQIEEKKAADPLFTENLTRINAALDEQKARLDELHTAMNRPAAADEGKNADKGDIEYKKAFFDGFLRKGESKLGAEEFKALSAGSDPDGGYTVPVEMSSQIIKTIYETTPMRQVASVQTISTKSLEMLVDKDEAAATWVGETGAASNTNTPQFGKLNIPTFTIAAEPRATQELLEDSAMNLESWLSEKVSDKFARTENAAFLTGDGVAKPRGLLSYTASADSGSGVTWGNIGYVASGASGDWAASNPADKLIQLVYTLKAAYLARAQWLMSRTRVQEVRVFKEATTNAYIWQPGLAAGEPDRLLGYPITKAEDMPAKAANSLSVAFGDYKSAYQIVDRRGIAVIRDIYTAKPFVLFNTTKRVGGDVINYEAFKVLKFANS